MGSRQVKPVEFDGFRRLCETNVPQHVKNTYMFTRGLAAIDGKVRDARTAV